MPSKQPGWVATAFGALFGGALLLFGLWVLLVSLLFVGGIQPPNPYVTDGDPCCGYPDTWADTRGAAVGALVWQAAGLAVILLGAKLVGWQQRPRRIVLVWGAAVVVTGAAYAVYIVQLDERDDVRACRGAEQQLNAARPASRAELERLADHGVACGTFQRRREWEILKAFGEPRKITEPKQSLSDPLEQVWHYDYEALTVSMEDHIVTGATSTGPGLPGLHEP